MNDSIDFALHTMEGSALQRTGALVAIAFSPNEHLTLRGVNIPVPEDLRFLLEHIPKSDRQNNEEQNHEQFSMLATK